MNVDTRPFDLDVLEEIDTEERFAVIRRRGTEAFVEADFVDAIAHLRETDLDAYEMVWDLVELLSARGAPLEALVS